MRLLIFDTETTGLPKTYTSASNGPDNWPHIVSISWIVFDGIQNRVLEKRSYIVRPDGWEIPDESVQIHGITTEKAKVVGVSLSYAIDEFLKEEYDAVVAHNLHFDSNVIKHAILWDLKRPFVPLKGRHFCTMKLTTHLCKLPSIHGGYKFPKLKELYKFVFKQYPEETSLHNSLFDSEILTEIIQHCTELRKAIGLPIMGTLLNNGVYENRNRTLSVSFINTH
jgi:DNA polymerase III epsilon subunit-like protein